MSPSDALSHFLCRGLLYLKGEHLAILAWNCAFCVLISLKSVNTRKMTLRCPEGIASLSGFITVHWQNHCSFSVQDFWCHQVVHYSLQMRLHYSSCYIVLLELPKFFRIPIQFRVRHLVFLTMINTRFWDKCYQSFLVMPHLFFSLDQETYSGTYCIQ